MLWLFSTRIAILAVEAGDAVQYEEQNILAIAEYFASGCKEDQLLGFELEHFVVDKRSGCTISYSDGVEAILRRLGIQCMGKFIFSQKHIIGFTATDANITVEPAAQLEISIRPSSNTKEIEQIYHKFIMHISPILDEMGYALVCAGYQPRSKADDLELIPSKRYEYMDSYFRSTGTRGKYMMKGTAATQVSIDYKSETDFNKKYRVASILGPIFAFIFDNTLVFEGKDFMGCMARTYIWNDVDPARSGVVPGSLDGPFSFYDYAKYVYNLSPIILNGSYFGARTTADIFHNRAITHDEIEQVSSMVFTDVRLKTHLEIRMADSMTITPALIYVDLLKDIFYNEAALERFYRQTLDIGNNGVALAKEALMRHGEKAVVYGRPAGVWLSEILGGDDKYAEFKQILRGFGTQ